MSIIIIIYIKKKKPDQHIALIMALTLNLNRFEYNNIISSWMTIFTYIVSVNWLVLSFCVYKGSITKMCFHLQVCLFRNNTMTDIVK